MTLRLSPFGVVVGGVLLVTATVPVWAPAGSAGSVDPVAVQARRDADQLRAELEDTQDRVDQLEDELADANQRLEAAGLPPATATTAPTAGGTGPQSPSDGLPGVPGTTGAGTPPGETEPEPSDAPPGTGDPGPGTTAPPATSPPTTPPPTAGPPASVQCPTGTRPVLTVKLGGVRAWVCLAL